MESAINYYRPTDFYATRKCTAIPMRSLLSTLILFRTDETDPGDLHLGQRQTSERRPSARIAQPTTSCTPVCSARQRWQPGRRDGKRRSPVINSPRCPGTLEQAPTFPKLAGSVPKDLASGVRIWPWSPPAPSPRRTWAPIFYSQQDRRQRRPAPSQRCMCSSSARLMLFWSGGQSRSNYRGATVHLQVLTQVQRAHLPHQVVCQGWLKLAKETNFYMYAYIYQ